MFVKQYRFPRSVPENSSIGQRYTFIDIETTGLKRDTTILYLIGCGYYEEDTFYIVQWFNDDGVSEPAMLLALQDFLKQHPYPLFTFNGESFDIPYLNRHYELNAIDYRLYSDESLDLYRILRPFQSLFHLSHGKQKDWEKFLGIRREDLYTGGQLINIYKKYLLRKDPELLNFLLLHNMEDLCGMEALFPLVAYQSLLRGQFTLEKFSVSTDSSVCATNIGKDQFSITDLIAVCRLQAPLPKPLRLSVNFTDENLFLSDTPLSGTRNNSMMARSSVDINGCKMQLTIPIFCGTLKYFYPDYKNYFYLPKEDRAIHKSVGCYVDSQFREKAKPSTCYIRKNGSFLPLFPNQKYKGIETMQKSYTNFLTIYKNNYKDKYSFVEMQSLFEGNSSLANTYLCDYLKNLFIIEMKKAAT